MANRKNYNSIFFLTVYLGLVLVGASPQVLAYAATNSLFDLRNEIEYKDDFDNKPDDEEINDFLALEPEKAIAEFIGELRKVRKSGRRISDSYIETKCGHVWSKHDYDDGASIAIRQEKYSNVKDLLNNLWKHYEKFFAEVQKDNLPSFYKYSEDYKVEFSQILTFQKRNLEIKIKFSHGSSEQAKSFAEYLSKAFSNKDLQAKNKITKITYENTKAFPSEGYVTVITNLPRASIDSLLK